MRGGTPKFAIMLQCENSEAHTALENKHMIINADRFAVTTLQPHANILAIALIFLPHKASHFAPPPPGGLKNTPGSIEISGGKPRGLALLALGIFALLVFALGIPAGV